VEVEADSPEGFGLTASPEGAHDPDRTQPHDRVLTPPDRLLGERSTRRRMSSTSRMPKPWLKRSQASESRRAAKPHEHPGVDQLFERPEDL
jgi:hypothetical protein